MVHFGSRPLSRRLREDYVRQPRNKSFLATRFLADDSFSKHGRDKKQKTNHVLRFENVKLKRKTFWGGCPRRFESFLKNFWKTCSTTLRKLVRQLSENSLGAFRKLVGNLFRKLRRRLVDNFLKTCSKSRSQTHNVKRKTQNARQQKTDVTLKKWFVFCFCLGCVFEFYFARSTLHQGVCTYVRTYVRTYLRTLRYVTLRYVTATLHVLRFTFYV